MKQILLFRRRLFTETLQCIFIFLLTTFASAQAILPVNASFSSATTSGPGSMPTGFTQSGLGGYSGALKFDTQGDWLSLQFDASPKSLTFDIGVNNSFTATTLIPSTAVFTIQESTNGTTWTTVTALTNSPCGNKVLDVFSTSTRYIRWYYTTKPSGTNIALKNIYIVGFGVDPIIQFDNQATAVYPQSILSMTGISNSPGAITYASSNTGIATINSTSGAVIGLNAGTSIITLYQAAATGYNTVNKTAILTVYEDDFVIISAYYEKTYGYRYENGTYFGGYYGVQSFTPPETLGTGPHSVYVNFGMAGLETAPATVDGVSPAYYPNAVVISNLVLNPTATVNLNNYHITYVPGSVRIRKANQAITSFPATLTKVYGAADYNPNAIAGPSPVYTPGFYTNTQPITYTSSNPNVATIVNGMVHIIKAGTTVITATKPGNENYNQKSVSQTLTIAPKYLPIWNISALDKYYDGTTIAQFYGTPTLIGILPQDTGNVSIGNLSGEFATSEVGNNIPVFVSSILFGSAASNYVADILLYANILPPCTSTSSSQTVTSCNSYYWPVNGITYTTSGTYQYTTFIGCCCANTRWLYLTITPNTSNTNVVSACNSYTWSVNGQTYTLSGTYTSVTGCHTEILNLTITGSCSTVVNLKLYIEGYYNGGGMMKSVKFNQDNSSPLSDVETISIELHDASAPFQTVASTTAILQSDGTAVCSFTTALNGLYYIAVKGSNIIQTWSALPQSIGSSPLNYDFTNAISKAYGNNMAQVSPGVWAFYSGDINQDNVIDNTDAPDLAAAIESSAFGNQVTDLNGDGAVDNSDAPFFENNATNSIFAIYPQ